MSVNLSESPIEFYQAQITQFQAELSAVKKKLFWVGMLRLMVFLSFSGLIYLFRSQVNLMVIFGIVGIAIFLFMVSKNTDIKLAKRRLEKLIALNNFELEILKGNLSVAEKGEEFISENHYYNQDIDLFGAGSIFQLINRTSTQTGRERLASILNANSIDAIDTKQAAIKELKAMPKWRQNFQITAELVNVKVDHQVILKWLKNYKPTIPAAFKFIPLIVSLLSFACIIGFGFGFIPGQILGLWIFIGFIITGPFFGRISKLYNSVSEMTDTISQYAKLLEQIEHQTFDSELLTQAQENIKNESKKASEIFKLFSQELNNLDQRNNIFFAFVANGYFLWDLRYAYRIENWIKTYQPTTDRWFETIAEFDAYNSLSNYAFNSPTHIYPELSTDEKMTMNATELGHPLLNVAQRITNDFKIQNEDFFIITGANMAGKSTFLRTVALNIVMANIGLPVCAKTFKYRPIKLISSMRTSDSLMNDESYFFSELKRLKFIVDEIKTDRYFIILDEILKGTNSKDKEEGSKKFVEKLVSSNSTGIIATHDLSLCALSEVLPQVENHYFDAEIVNNELYFDYRFKDGICQNMNASFLLKKMEIV